MPAGISPTAVNIEAFLRPSLFGTLPDSALRHLAAQAAIESFPEATRLNSVGKRLEYLRLVIEGGVTITATHASGREVMVGTVGPGGWASWMPCFEQQPMATDYTAVEGSLCIALPMEAVRLCFNTHPHLYPLVLREVGKRMRLLMEWTTQSALLPPPQRLARLLTLLARERGVTSSNSTALPVTRAHLATLVGCTRQSAGKLFAKLEDLGLIRAGYGVCEIPDIAALKRYSDSC